MVPQEVAVSRGVHWGERLVARRAARSSGYTTTGRWLAALKEGEEATQAVAAMAIYGMSRSRDIPPS